MNSRLLLNDDALTSLQRKTFNYFLDLANPVNGLIIDKTAPNWPASIAATGMALAAYPIGVERGWMSRRDARARTLATLRFFAGSPQGPEPDSTGYKGFYYHFLDMQTGRRVWDCELSTVDSAFLIAGGLTAGVYFSEDGDDEREIRHLAELLYRRADWDWARNEGETLTHGWRPETGFIPYRWEGYDEALLLYVLALASPTHPIPESSYQAWTTTYRWEENYGYEYLYAGPLFIHQFSHIWLDCRGVQDDFMRSKGIDYFENTRRATHVQQRYAIDNPLKFVGYDEFHWGITACDGPGPDNLKIDGIQRTFYDYINRGAPYGPDDGTLAPWAVVASLPFAPEIVIPTVEHLMEYLEIDDTNRYGFKATFNQTFPCADKCWVSPWTFGIDQGPIVMMIENYRTGMLWHLMQHCPHILYGFQKAGFGGGWLGSV